MPELPEVETVRRMLADTVVGRVIRAVSLSGKPLRAAIPPSLPGLVRGRAIQQVGRHGKYLLLHLSDGLTLLSHLGMSGRWLFYRTPAERPGTLPHVHVQIAFADDAALWFQDARRFGLLHPVATRRLGDDPWLAGLGPDPLATKLGAAALHALARGARVNVKTFLMDQGRLAGIGNIYASEILFRARVDPRRPAGRLDPATWRGVASAMRRVLEQAIARMGTTFSTYRTLWNEPGQFAERLAVYDRAGQPCRRCGTPIRRLVQGQRSTFFCPGCQGRSTRGGSAPSGRAVRAAVGIGSRTRADRTPALTRARAPGRAGAAARPGG